MLEKVTMNELTRFLGGTRWEKRKVLGFTHFTIYKGIETIGDYRSLYEADYHLTKIIRGL